MKFHLFKYTCKNCGCQFKAPEIGFDAYGEFLLRSSSGETVYINAMSDSTYQEVDQLMKKLPVNQGVSAVKLAEILRKIFGIACDIDSKGQLFSINTKPKCPSCGSNEMSYWEATEPPEYVDKEFPNVTHDKWQSMTDNEKLKLLSDSI